MKAWLRHTAFAFVLVLLATAGSPAQETRFDFGILDTPKPAPDLNFTDVNRRRLSLEDFRGKYVLLNIWATWCPPCRAELPSLERLQRELGSADFQVVALSTDTGRDAAVQRLYRELGLDDSGIFIDETGSVTGALGIFGMPTTLLIDPERNEIGRKIGPAVWDSPAAVEFFRNEIESGDNMGVVPNE